MNVIVTGQLCFDNLFDLMILTVSIGAGRSEK